MFAISQCDDELYVCFKLSNFMLTSLVCSAFDTHSSFIFYSIQKMQNILHKNSQYEFIQEIVNTLKV